jgi:multiple sugar transport system permease protein|uniref:carbohydrate ABC transporter permease n=1 Tax=Candidatus Planktophila sp. TaxID=2175601 RepID=UPI004049D7DE
MAAAKKKRPVSYHLVNFGIGFLGLFAILPLIWTFYTSLRSNVDINKFPTKFSLSNLSFDAYFGVWRDTNFPMLMKNSLIVSTMTVIISLALGTFAGYALSRSKFRGRQSVLLVYLAIRLVPGVLLLIPMYLFMNRLGLLDSYIGLTLAYTTFTLPATIWLMKGFFDSLPPDLENAARIDGCSRMGAMWRISIPLVLPGLAATGTLTAITAWNDVLFALLLTSSDRTRTWPVGLREMIGEFQLPWDALTATSILSLLPVVIGFALVGRKMVAGITAGSLKD